MNRDDFKMVSIRGRLAYAISCLENALKYYKCNTTDWRIVLEQLWTYTDIQFFDDWHYTIAEILPESVLESNIFDVDDHEYINEMQFICLHNLYSNTNNEIKDIIQFIFNIGICEFYGKLENYGQLTLDNMEVLINYMISNSIPLPDMSRFKVFYYDDGNGWGEKFSGIKYSCIL
jgi:hypothetical protein